MARRVRDWREADHPRWPPGSGDKSGEFRDKSGGDWVDRLGDALPAGRYGSISTGQTAQCPFCGRTVKIVGTSGKLSTHNASKGVRCGGSGQTVSESEKAAGGVVARRARRGPRNPEIKAPERRRIVPGPSRSTIIATTDEGHIAQRRMDRWREGAARPGRVVGQNEKTRREWEIENTEKEIKQTLAPNLEYAQARARREIREQMYAAGEDPDSMQARIDWGWNDQVEFKTRHEVAYLQQALDYLDALRNRKRIPDQQGVRMGLGGHPRRQWSPTELDVMVSAGEITLPRQYDPAHPLDVYGDLLHIEDDTWFSYQALDTLEQDIPPVFHEVAAAHIASQKTWQGKEIGGIWVSGTRRLPELDDLGHLRTGKPRGWRKGSTWNEPDGVVSAGHTLAVAWTENVSEATTARQFHTQSGRAAEMGNPLVAVRMDPSAMGHEFGHLLDYALGARTGGAAASRERLWRLVHGRVKREAGRLLNPYFRQKGDAGPGEFWADSFGVWARGSDAPVLYHSTVPVVAGTPVQYPDVKGKIRTVTWRVQAIATAYDIPYDVAFEVSDYFDRLHKEVKSGKRKTRLQSRGY